jgi:hypothetical protein
MKETFSVASRRTIQAIGVIGLALGLGLGGTFPFDQLRLVLLMSLFGSSIGAYLIFISIETPARGLKAQGCGLLGFGLGLGMGGTFPDGTEWVTWLLCAFWCIFGVWMLLTVPQTDRSA